MKRKFLSRLRLTYQRIIKEETVSVQKSSWLLLLTFTLVLTLTACGGQKESAAPSPAATATPPPAATTAPAESAPAKTENTPAPTPTPAPAQAAPTATDTPQPAAVAVKAATVHQAAQLLDLRQLALPEKAESAGQAEVGNLSYQTPLEVKAVVDFYRSLLTKEGWQEVAGQGYADDTVATLYFTKEGFTISLSASQMGDAGVSVTVMHHGNVAPSTLPQMANAEGVIAAPNTLIYFSTTPVSEVAEFTRKELAAQGWQEYTRPNTASANNPDSQTLAFKQNGLELSAYIATAPAQNGKTSVQYNVILLPLDLPTPADATAIEMDASQPYLSFKTPAKPEKVVEFYRQAMTDLGWTEVADSAAISAEQTSLAFANEAEKLALTLTAVLADGQTTATLSAFGTETPVAAESDSSDSVDSSVDSNEAEPTSEAVSVATGEMPDLPSPDDAQNLAYDPDAAQITYHSPSDIATLVKFYRQALPPLDWQENEIEGIVTEIFGYLSFSKGEANLTIDLTGDVINKGTSVTLDVSDLAPPQEIAATSEPAADGPTYTIKDWPVPPEAEKVKQSGDKLNYVVGWDLPKVAEFYRSTFELMDLGSSCLDGVAEYSSMSCSSSNGQLSLNFFAFESGDKQTEVEIEFTNSAMPSSDSGGTEAGGESGDSGQLTAEDQDGLPVPDNHTSLSSEGSPYSRKITLASPSNAESLLAFFQTELAKAGWESKETLAEGETTSLTFTGSNGELKVEIKPSGDETEVTLTTRDPAAAAKAGILPPTGQSRLYMVNFSPDELAVTVNGQEVKVKGEAGMNSPDDAPKLDLPPGSYEVTIKAGSKTATTQVELGADQVWALMLDPEGGMPMQLY